MSNTWNTAHGLLNFVVGRNGIMGSGLSRLMRAWTVMPDAIGLGGTEVTGGSYAPVTLVVATHFNTAPNFAAVANSGDISFPAATASWGTVVGVTFHITGDGTFLRLCRFATPIAVASGQTLRIPAGNLTLTQG